MKGYIKQHFGVSFYKENIEFIVNKERKIVTCIMDGVLKTPYGFDTPVHINPLPVEGIGIAKCHPNDIFVIIF
jgi:hypothetical protein